MAETKVTFCRICEAGCGLLADVEGGRVTKLRPDPEHVISRGYACVKGIRYTEVHGSPDRVTTPLKREGDRFIAISWQQALTEIGRKVQDLRRKHGGQSIGMYVGNPAAFSLPHPLFAQMFLASLGSRNLFTSGSQDCNNKFVVGEELYGSALYQPVPDIDHTSCFIVIGANPAISHMSFMQFPRPVERLKAIEKRGGKVYFVNPRRTESAEQVGEQVFIRPGTDVFLLLSFARELFARRKISARALMLTEGAETLERLCAPWTMERTAKVTGVSVGTLDAMITRYLAADGAALYCSTGVNQGTHGTLSYWLLNAINVLSGNVDRRGGLIIPKGQVRGAKAIKQMSKGLTPVGSRIGQHAPVLGSYPAAILPDEITTPGDGQIRAMFISAGNPLLSCPNTRRLEQAFRSLELIVSIDLFRNETGELAHYVLPATSFLERDDVPLSMQGFQPIAYIQHVDAVVPAAGEARDEWWIYAALAHACGSRYMNSRLLQWWLDVSTGMRQSFLPEVLHFSPRLLYQGVALSNGKLWSSLKKHEHGLLLAETPAQSFLGKTVLRPNKRVHLAPAVFVEEALKLESAFEQERVDAKRLLLISQRDKTSHNSWMHNVASLVRGTRSTNYLTLNPEDAQSLGLQPGQIAEVSTPQGRLRVPVRVSDEMMPSVVSLPHGWGHESANGLSVARETTGVNANVLTPDGTNSVERLSGMAHLTGVTVHVKPWLTVEASESEPGRTPRDTPNRFVDLH